MSKGGKLNMVRLTLEIICQNKVVHHSENIRSLDNEEIEKIGNHKINQLRSEGEKIHAIKTYISWFTFYQGYDHEFYKNAVDGGNE